MSDPSRIAALGMQLSQERLEVISANAASATLPGYRRQVVAAQSFDSVLASQELQAPARAVDLRSGELMATGRALDVSIDDANAFFALTDGTRTWLTRAGAFSLDAQGVLTGTHGLHVVGAQGDLQLSTSDVQIESDGRIARDGMEVGKLQLFRPDEPSSLRPASGVLLEATQGMHPVDVAEVQVRAGTLEASNTNSTQEMVDVIALARQFESLSRVVQGYDEMLGRTIQKLTEGV